PSGGWPLSAPAWLLSLAIHLLLAISGSLLIRHGISSHTPSEQPERRGEIVIAVRSEPRTAYFEEETPARHQVLRPVTGDSTIGGAAAGVGPGQPPPLLANVTLPDATSPMTTDGLVATPQLGPARGKPRVASNLDE